MRNEPDLLRMSSHEKVWGSTRLSPWFPDSDRKIGEVWYERDQPLPVLVKLLFTPDRLSVEVHPDDDYAAMHELDRGLTRLERFIGRRRE